MNVSRFANSLNKKLYLEEVADHKSAANFYTRPASKSQTLELFIEVPHDPL